MNLNDFPEDFRECAEFHGHICPGLSIGYRAAKYGLKELAVNRADDEEVVAVVENDSCAVDAVQVLTGCTFGKGNLIFRDYGKMVFIFAVRKSGKFVRLYFKGVEVDNAGNMTETERRAATVKLLMESKDEELFELTRPNSFSMPDTAEIHENIICDNCGERVMSTRITECGNRKLCESCK